MRVTDVVVLEAGFFLGVVGIGPEEVENALVAFSAVRTKLDFEWSLDLLNVLDVLDSWTNSTMAAEYSLLLISYNSSQWHLLKSLVDLGKS